MSISNFYFFQKPLPMRYDWAWHDGSGLGLTDEINLHPQ